MDYIIFLMALFFDKTKSKFKKVFKCIYCFFTFCVFFESISILSIGYPLCNKMLWIVSATCLFYIFRFFYFILNLGATRNLLSIKTIFLCLTEYLVFFYLTTFWIINCIALIFSPKQEYFSVVTILSVFMHSWIYWRLSSIENRNNYNFINVFIPLVISCYAFILSLFSLIISFHLFYQANELLIFISLSLYFIIKSYLGEDHFEYPGILKILKVFLDKSFLRFALLLITNLATFTNNNVDFIRSVNAAILVSISFDTLNKNRKPQKRPKYSQSMIDNFISCHLHASCKYSNNEYLKYMTKRYKNIKVVDLTLIDESISYYFANNFAEYIPPFPFSSFITINDLYKAATHTNLFISLKYLFLHISKDNRKTKDKNETKE